MECKAQVDVVYTRRKNFNLRFLQNIGDNKGIRTNIKINEYPCVDLYEISLVHSLVPQKNHLGGHFYL